MSTLGFSFDLITVASYIAVTALFFGSFPPASRGWSWVAAILSVAGFAVSAASLVFHAIAVAIVRGLQYFPVFPAEPLQGVVLHFLRLRAQTAGIGIAFFGVYCLLIGCVIFRWHR